MAKELLSEIAPHLLKEWDKNNEENFFSITASNPKRVAWICESHGHKWVTSVAQRARAGSGCPVCSNKTIVAGFNDLATKAPEIAAEWAYEKNDKHPTQVGVGSKEKAWWVCSAGHEWEARITGRVKQNSGCPYCAGQRVVNGLNDLVTLYPEIAKEFHPNKNGETKVETLAAGTPKKVWWLCDKGHEYVTSVHQRTKRNVGCGICKKSRVTTNYTPPAKKEVKPLPVKVNIPQEKQFFHIFPNLIPEYMATLNTLPLEQVSVGSVKKVWWKCDKEHEYEMEPAKRKIGRACPYCVGKAFKPEWNSISAMDPILAKEWDEKLNGKTASEVYYGGKIKAHWVCDEGHRWEATIVARVNGSGCPICSNRVLFEGFNDLKTFYPILASQFDVDKNDFPVEMLTHSSTKKVWWKCDKGHEWENTPQNRTFNRMRNEEFSGNGCPKCSQKVSQPEKEIFAYLQEIGVDNIIRSDRTVLGGKELDIYIPDKKIAIEYNGLYWHSESQGKGQQYHYNKWRQAREKGIQLIQIWEDDWRDNKNLWKRMLKFKLGLGHTEGAVYARHTTIVEFAFKDVKEYMDLNHLQGKMFGTKYLGLVDKEKNIVSLLVVTLRDDVLEITRFMTSKQVPGGFSKLLKHAISLYPEVSQIVSFSENSISDGNLYAKTGFNFEKSMTAYSYIVVDKGVSSRVHRRNFTKQKYESREDLLFEEGLTEKQLAELNGLNRVWDAGNTKWVKYL